MQMGFNTIGTFSHKIQGLNPVDGVTTRLPWISTLRVTNSVVNDQLVGNVWENIGGGKFPDMYHPALRPRWRQRRPWCSPRPCGTTPTSLPLYRPGGRTARHRSGPQLAVLGSLGGPADADGQ